MQYYTHIMRKKLLLVPHANSITMGYGASACGFFRALAGLLCAAALLFAGTGSAGANAAPEQEDVRRMDTFIFRYAAVGERVELLAPPSFVMRSSFRAERYPLEGANRETFEILSPGVFPGADAKRLYDQAMHSLLNATPLKEPYGGQTPEALWGRDGAKVYYGARQVPGVDGTRDLGIFLDAEGSFHVFNAGKRVVLYRPTELLGFVAREYEAGKAAPGVTSLPARKDMKQIFPGQAPPLRFWGNVPDTPYMTDGKQLYYLAGREASPENPRVPVPLGANPATAEIIWHGLLRDGNTIWQRGEKTAYDGASFRWWSNWHSADANGVYYNGVKLVIRGGRNGEEAYAPRLE